MLKFNPCKRQKNANLYANPVLVWRRSQPDSDEGYFPYILSGKWFEAPSRCEIRHRRWTPVCWTCPSTRIREPGGTMSITRSWVCFKPGLWTLWFSEYLWINECLGSWMISQEMDGLIAWLIDWYTDWLTDGRMDGWIPNVAISQWQKAAKLLLASLLYNSAIRPPTDLPLEGLLI